MLKQKMMASILYQGGDIRYEETDIPRLGKNDVLVKVAYTGICGSDLHRSQAVNGARLYPLIIGHEFSGIIAEMGEEVTGYKVGEKVAVAPLIPDPNSIYSKEGNYGLSDNYNIIGTGSNGAMAEYVKVPQNHLIRIPDKLDLETAAGIEPATIAFHALRNSDIEPGDNVAVLGCGSIGQFAIQCAKIFGAKKVIGVDISDEKLQIAKEVGADITINSKTENLYEKIRDYTTYGVNLALETAGNKITQEQSLMITRKKGNVVFVGISHSELNLSQAAVDYLLRGELTIRGSWNSYTAPYPGRAWDGVMHAMAEGKIVFKPMISHRISLKDAGDYLRDMYNKRLNYNKVIIKVNP